MTQEFFILAIVSGVWLLVLSVALFLQQRFFNKLVKETDEKNLRKVLEKIIGRIKNSEADIISLEKEAARIVSDGRFHVQRVGLVRFNPFGEIGGDHSFSLAILDANHTGVVVTGLHTRERTRIYSKEIVKGKCKMELSREEKQAIGKAIK